MQVVRMRALRDDEDALWIDQRAQPIDRALNQRAITAERQQLFWSAAAAQWPEPGAFATREDGDICIRQGLTSIAEEGVRFGQAVVQTHACLPAELAFGEAWIKHNAHDVARPWRPKVRLLVVAGDFGQ